MKKQSSKCARPRYILIWTMTEAVISSRRFKAGGSEYKWKQAENGKDLLVSMAHLPNAAGTGTDVHYSVSAREERMLPPGRQIRPRCALPIAVKASSIAWW